MRIRLLALTAVATLAAAAPASATVVNDPDEPAVAAENAGGSGLDPVTVKQEPLGAPDTISYTFNSLAIGNPTLYSWYARAGAPVVDFAPDRGCSKFPPPPRLEELNRPSSRSSSGSRSWTRAATGEPPVAAGAWPRRRGGSPT